MKHYEYPSFFWMIFKMFIADSEFYKYFIRLGFNPHEWPACDAKPYAAKFHDLAQTKSVEFAKIKFKNMEHEIVDYPIPGTANEVSCMFEEMKTFGLWDIAGRAIVASPLRGPEIVASLRKSSSGVTAILLQESIEQEVIAHISALKNKESFVKTISGWEKLSAAIGGFNPSRISLLVAGSGVGKTTISLNLAISAIQTMPTLFVNMEMSPRDFTSRIIQLGAGITSSEWLYGYTKETSSKAADFCSQIYNSKNFFFTDGRALSLDQLGALIYEFKEKHQVEFVVIDYDQKIKSSSKQDEWMTVLMAIEELEQVAIKTETYIMVLAQGDENNNPKASKRSIQPCASVLAFYMDEARQKYIVEATKNRFEKKFMLEVACDFSKYQVKEKDLINDVLPVSKRGLR